MGIYAIKPKFQQTLAPITRWCVVHQVSPTLINVGGVLVSVAMAVVLALYGGAGTGWLWLIPLGGFLRTALNALDGLVSRGQGLASGWGELLNEFLDRVSDAVIFSAFFFVADIAAELVAAVVIMILLNSYLSIAAKAAGGPRLYGGMVGKADRMIYLGVAAVAATWWSPTLVFSYFLYVLAAATAITLMQRLGAAYRALAT